MIASQESITAKLCSFARAYHSNVVRQKIFDDYLAYDLMGREEYEEIGQLVENDFQIGSFDKNRTFSQNGVIRKLNHYITPIPLSRIAFAEKQLEKFAEIHGQCQYVICGAGMDTFSFRNENPAIRIFELDHPDTRKYKLEKIKKLEWIIPDNVRFVAIDFAKDDMLEVLERSGFDRNIPTFFAILGVAYYLTFPVFAKTLSDIANLSPTGSRVVFDYPDETTFSENAAKRVGTLAKITAQLGEPMLHGFSYRELEAALLRYGFRISIHETPQSIQKQFFDNRTDGQRAFENIHFILAEKKEKNKMSSYIFSSESVTKGHPDKVSDIISDSILDAYIAKDPNAHVAAETVVKNNTIFVVGEVSSTAEINTEAVIRNAVRSIGYTKEEYGFNADTAEIILRLDRQSPDIAQGVNNALETRSTDAEEEIGAGDQGIIFGFATDETEDYISLAASLSHKLAKRLSDVREDGTLAYLRPDGKTQVSVKYVDNKAAALDTVLVSAQHDPDVTQEKIREDIIEYVIKPVVPEYLLDENTRILVNPTGRFVIGGPVGDSGLTGRKIIVDTYGGAARHGGGAFSGKDPTKVDRSAAYAARYIAKNIVAAGLAKKAEIQLAYAIGVASPVSVNVETFGTGIVDDEELNKAITELVDLRPKAIINRLALRNPIYAKTASYGHFGREGFSWEETDLADSLKEYFGANLAEAV